VGGEDETAQAVTVGGKLMRMGEVSGRTGLMALCRGGGAPAPLAGRCDRSASARAMCGRCRTGSPTRRARAGRPGTMSTEHTYEELVTRLRKDWVRADERREDLRREPGAAGERARSPYGQPARLGGAPTALRAGRR
jgi:hypothetical protein